MSGTEGSGLSRRYKRGQDTLKRTPPGKSSHGSGSCSQIFDLSPISNPSPAHKKQCSDIPIAPRNLAHAFAQDLRQDSAPAAFSPESRKRNRRKERSNSRKKFARTLRETPNQLHRIDVDATQEDQEGRQPCGHLAPAGRTGPPTYLPSSPPGLTPANATAPWCGNVSGFTWNPNGFVTLDEKAKLGKAKTILKLLEKRDFCVITDTHSIEERSIWYDQYFETQGYKIFWSHKVQRNGGVAIIARRSFIAQFACYHRQVICPGQCICLRLKTANGKGLDIIGCYLPASGAYLRRRLIGKIYDNINPKAHSLTLGDFKFHQ